MAEASVDYGLDAPLLTRSYFTRAAWTVAFGAVLFWMNHEQYPGPATTLFVVLALIAALLGGIGWVNVWSSRVAKPGVRDRLLNELALNGEEKILDVGCGRGLFAIGAAKRLKTGKVTGIDVWNPADLSGNTAAAARENCKAEGVADKVTIEDGDARKLSYRDSSFDVVLASLALHHIPDGKDRDQALREMWRVLKPGGKLLLFDLGNVADYADLLKGAGAKDVALSGASFLWCARAQSLTARK